MSDTIQDRLRSYGRRPHVICREAADRIDALEAMTLQQQAIIKGYEATLGEVEQQRDELAAALREIAEFSTWSKDWGVLASYPSQNEAAFKARAIAEKALAKLENEQ